MEDFEDLGGCVDESLFRLSSLTPSSFLDFPADKKGSVTVPDTTVVSGATWRSGAVASRRSVRRDDPRGRCALVRPACSAEQGDVHPPFRTSCLSSGDNTQDTGAPLPFSFLVWAGVGDRELAEDTGLARSAYISSESTLCTELLLDVALDTEETLLTLRDLDTHTPFVRHVPDGATVDEGF